MWVPPQCFDQMPACEGCDHCAKSQSVRVDVEFGGVGSDGLYSVDFANVEILTKDARYARVANSSRFDVEAPIRREELRKSNLYAQLCKERSRQFIPAIMSSYGAPGAGTLKMVAILAEIAEDHRWDQHTVQETNSAAAADSKHDRDRTEWNSGLSGSPIGDSSSQSEEKGETTRRPSARRCGGSHFGIAQIGPELSQREKVFAAST